MAYSVSNDYKNVIYSQDAKNKLKLLFNNVELQDADLYCEKLTVKSRIVPNGAKAFSLNNFISKEAELILHNVNLDDIQNQVSISIGTLVGNSYEYVPIGIFNIQDQPTTDKNRTTIKLRDNSTKFDFNYNAQTIIEENGGSVTKLQILQDICTQAGVTCNITSFIGYLDEIGVYDSTVSARQYIANIAEQAGRIATINRNGELIFIDLNDLTTWEIPIEIVEKYESGTKYKIGKVVYEDGIVKYQTENSNYDTLFLNGSNNYINGELVKEQASSTDNTYYLQNTGESNLDKFELDGKTTQATRNGKNLFNKYGDFNYPNDASIGTNKTTLQADGTIKTTANFANWRSKGVQLLLAPNTNYIVSGKLVSSTGTGSPYIGIVQILGHSSSTWSNNINYISLTSIGDFSFTFNSGNYTEWFLSLNSYGSGGTSCEAVYDKIQVELGSTVTSYEDYGMQPSPDYPSNLINVGAYNSGTNKYEIEVKTTGKNLINNNDIQIGKAWNNASNTARAIIIMPVKPSTNYTISFNSISGLDAVYCFGRENENDSTRTMGNYEIANTRTLKTTADTHYLGMQFNKNNISKEDIENCLFQVEKGNVKTNYEEYKSNTYLYSLNAPLRGIGDTKDLLYIENGYLYVKRYIGSKVFNGSESWYRTGATRLSYVNYTEISSLNNNNVNAISNYFKGIGWNNRYANIGTVAVDPSSVVLTFEDNKFSSVDELKSWLSTHNTEVQYVLETPTTEGLGESLIPTTYNDITHIDIYSQINTKTYIQYRKNKTQLEQILDQVNEFEIDSFKMGKILGNPAIDSYDLIQIVDGNNTYTTLATNDLTYTGALINTFDTQIGEEEKEQNVTINGEETFKKWAKTKIDNVEGSISLQAGKIDDLTGELNDTKVLVRDNGTEITVVKSYFDDDGNAKGVKTVENKYTFDDEGLKIQKNDTDYNTLIDNTGTYYKDGNTIVSMTNKDGFLAKDFRLQGQHYYSYNASNPTEPLSTENYDFVDERIEIDGEYAYATFYNGGD